MRVLPTGPNKNQPDGRIGRLFVQGMPSGCAEYATSALQALRVDAWTQASGLWLDTLPPLQALDRGKPSQQTGVRGLLRLRSAF